MRMKRLLSITSLIVSAVIVSGCAENESPGSYTGIVEGRTYSLSSQMSGKILNLPFNEGETVRAGDLVALLDTTETALQIKNAGTLLEELRLQLQNSDLQREQAATSLDYYRDKYEKNVKLSESKAVPAQTLDDLKLQIDLGRSRLEMSELGKKILSKKLEETQTNLEILLEKLSKASIESPVEGVIDKLYYEKGEIPPPMSAIADIINLDDVWCYIYASEVDLPGIAIGSRVKVRVDGLDGVLEGRIDHINKQAEFTPKTILTPDNRKALVFGIKITIDNTNHVLKPGMTVEVELPGNDNA